MGGWIGRPQDRWRVPQHNPLILWLGRQIEEDVAPRQECLPGVFNGLPYLDQRLVEFVLDLLDDGLQQALLAIELVIESAAGEADCGGDLVHGCVGVADLAERGTTRRYQLGARDRQHVRACTPRLRHHDLQSPNGSVPVRDPLLRRNSPETTSCRLSAASSFISGDG